MTEARDDWWTSWLCGRAGGGRLYFCVFGSVFFLLLVFVVLDELHLLDPTTLQGELGGGCNKGIEGTLAVGRLPDTHEDMSAS